MLRTIEISIEVTSGQEVFQFPSNSLGLLKSDIVKGISMRTGGKNKNDASLVSSDILDQSFLTLKENGGKTIHQSLSLAKILSMSESDRFQMLPVEIFNGINWEESTIKSVATLTTGQVFEFTIFYITEEDSENC